MKGLILAGGEGTRLRPLTYVLPKSLLPIYDKPLVFYPLITLLEAGIREIVILTDTNYQERFKKLLGTGERFGAQFYYVTQDAPLGIAHAVAQAEPYCRGDKLAVVLGDNIFEDNLKQAVKSFEKQKIFTSLGPKGGAKLVLKKVPDPERFGVVEFEGERVKGIEEKPRKPKSNWITTGMFMYDERVFDIIKTLKPSARGEYEITDVNNFYVKEGTVTYEKLKKAWFDVGTIEARHEACKFIASSSHLWKKRLRF